MRGGELQPEGGLPRIVVALRTRRACDFLGIGIQTDDQAQRLALALSPDHHFHRIVGLRLRDQMGQTARRGNHLPAELQDHVADAHTRRGRGTLFEYVGHERALGAVQPEAPRDVFTEHLDLHPHPAALDPAHGHEVVDDLLRLLRRDGEADAHVTAARAEDCGVDTDDPTRGIEEGASRVSSVDGGVNLQVVVEGTGLNVPPRARRRFPR